MQFIRARRLAAGVAVASVVLVAAPVPASAAPAAVAISMYAADITVPLGAHASTPVAPIWRATAEVTADEPTVTYEMRGLSGMTVAGDESGTCENASPGKLTCTSPSPLRIGPDGSSGGTGLTAYVRAGDYGMIGMSGTIRVTFSARGIEPITADVGVRVGQSVNLKGGPAQRTSAAPGGPVDAPLVVSNASGGTITGAAVLLDLDHALVSGPRYSNCFYLEDRLASCTFDQPLLRGRTYSAALPLTLRADTRAPSSAYGIRQWLTPAELEDFHAYLESRDISPGIPGFGEVLTLTEVPTARADVEDDVPGDVQGDPSPEDNWSALRVDVTGTNGVDLAAEGAELTGKPGDKIIMPVTVRSVGKATLDLSRLGSPAAVTAVTVPAGTTVLSAPPACYPLIGGGDDLGSPGTPGAARYECHSNHLLVAGTEESYRFELRIGANPGRTTGAVTVNPPCACERFADDIDTANNTAAIVVTAGTATGGGDGPGGGDGQGGGSGSDDPTLPITGPEGARIAGAGVALVVLGATMLLLAHRLRRFIG